MSSTVGIPNALDRLGLRALVLLATAASLILFASVACGDDKPSAEELREVEDIASRTFQATAEEADFFFAHVTDNLLKTVLFSNREDCMANAAECIGEPAPVLEVKATTIDGKKANTTVVAPFGEFVLRLLKDGETWKVDTMEATSDELPDGAKSVALRLVDFGFEFDAAAVPSSGNFGFKVANAGQQPHEVVVVSLPADGTVEEALEQMGEEDEPAGLKLFIQPGQSVDMAFESPLAPGRYALLCFFPDVEDAEAPPHFAKGMVAEFTVK